MRLDESGGESDLHTDSSDLTTGRVMDSGGGTVPSLPPNETCPSDPSSCKVEDPPDSIVVSLPSESDSSISKISGADQTDCPDVEVPDTTANLEVSGSVTPQQSS